MFNLMLAVKSGKDGTPFIRIRWLSADRTVQIACLFYLGVMLLNTDPDTKRKIYAFVKGLIDAGPMLPLCTPKSVNKGLSHTPSSHLLWDGWSVC